MKPLKFYLLVVGILCLPISGTRAQEKSTIVTPVVTTVTEYEIAGLSITRIPQWKLVISYADNLGKTQTDVHLGPTEEGGASSAEALILQLNKANLSIKSLERRLMEHLIAEGKIPDATITGTPR